MWNTPRLNRVLFGLYVFLTLGTLVAALIWPSVRAVAYAPLRDWLWPAFFLPTRAGIQADLKVAVPPALEGWARQAADEFTRQNTLITVEVVTLRGTEAARRLSAGVTDLPDVWVAEADFVRAGVGGIPYEATGVSIAQDSLVWVGVSSRSDLAGNLNWQTVFETARSDLQFRIAVPPVGSVEGMAACMSAAAEYHRQENLTASLVSDPAFRTWLDELLEAAPNRSRSARDQLGSRPPEVDVGLILNSDWRRLAQQFFFSQAPRYNVAFNYPYFVRSTWYSLPADEANARRAATVRFREFLLGDVVQGRLQDYGLGRAGAPVEGTVVRADEPAIRALQGCWQ